MEESKPTILIVGTLDTKAAELSYLYNQIVKDGSYSVQVLDVGWKPPSDLFSLPKEAIVRPKTNANIESLARGDSINAIIESAVPIAANMVHNNQVHGLVSAGGSCGTSIATAIMRQACPIGFPKLMITTMASGDIKHYVEETDIVIMPSVVDIAGMNSVLEQVLDNAAGAIIGITSSYTRRMERKKIEQRSSQQVNKKQIAISMFGVTTPCVDHIRSYLAKSSSSSSYEIYVFHATGAGGKAMERLIQEGHIDSLIDLTTTEIADELFGGVLSAGPSRLEAATKQGIPLVLSVGATDMINFGPMDSVPDDHVNKGRNLVKHNPSVTLMRTNKDECKQIGDFIVRKLSSFARKPENVKVLLPMAGVSMIDAPGKPFYDPEADQVLFETIEGGLGDTGIQIRKINCHINDDDFARELVSELEGLMGEN